METQSNSFSVSLLLAIRFKKLLFQCFATMLTQVPQQRRKINFSKIFIGDPGLKTGLQLPEPLKKPL
jgi:hypothetical protein